MSFLGIGGTPIVEIKIDGLDKRKHIPVKDKEGQSVKLPLYTGDDDISGTVELSMGKLKKFEHQGVKVELIGHIECLTDPKLSSDFMSMGRELEPTGILQEDKTYKFTFNKFEKSYENYSGTGIRLRYFIRVTIQRQYVPKMTKEVDIAVCQPITDIEPTGPLKLEVGIEECLHIEFEYNKSKYHMKDVVIGKVYFLLIRIKIKYMELAVVKKETIGTGTAAQTESETIGKYELMDGCPTKGEVIPIRLYLSAYNLTPTMTNINNKFSVKYYLSLVLVDEEDRRYFKQQEVQIWRKSK